MIYMYCPHCAEKTIGDEEFCLKCGYPLTISVRMNPVYKEPEELTVSIYIENTNHVQEPWVLWLGPLRSALICVPQNQDPDNEYGVLPRPGDDSNVFRNYAHGLASYSFEGVVTDHPGSFSFDTEEIRIVEYVTYTSDFDRIDDLESFILETPEGRFRCGYERGTDMSDVKNRISILIGDRYILKTMEKFPSE
jgi:hypothetical protein